MAMLKQNVSDADIEALFDRNDKSAFGGSTNDDSNEPANEEPLLPSELDNNSTTSKNIERPTKWQPDEVHEEKLRLKKELSALKKVHQEELLQTKGSVTKDIFAEVAKAREKAYLEEYQRSQAKLPVINPDAKVKLYSGQDQCNFHVYQTREMLPNNKIACACKFCSCFKEFTMEEWKQYQIENAQYL